MLSWQEWVCDRLNYKYYDLVIEDFTEEELEKLQDEYDEYVMNIEFPFGNEFDYDDEYAPSASKGDYSSMNRWKAPGMNIHDFI